MEIIFSIFLGIGSRFLRPSKSIQVFSMFIMFKGALINHIAFLSYIDEFLLLKDDVER